MLITVVTLIVFATTTLAAPVVDVDSPVEAVSAQTCGNSDPSYGFKLTAGHTNPDPAQKGKNITYSFDGTVSKDVEGGTIQFNLYYKLGARWVKGPFVKKYDLCTMNTCPLKAGPITIKLNSDVPAFVPHVRNPRVRAAVDRC